MSEELTSSGHKVHAKERWTEEEEDKLIQLYKAGKTYEEIATKFGRTIPSIKGKVHKHGLSEKHNRSTRKIIELYTAGYTQDEIAAKLNIDQATVSRKVKISIGRGKRHSLSDDEKDTIEEYYSTGCTAGCIARRIFRSKSTVADYISKQDIVPAAANIDDDLIATLSNDLSVFQIATKLGLSRTSIILSLKRTANLGAVFAEEDKADLEQTIVSMKKQGYTVERISEKTNIERSTLYRMLRKIAPETLRKSIKWTEEEDAKLKKMRTQGLSVKTISKKLNRPYSSIQSRLNIMAERG